MLCGSERGGGKERDVVSVHSSDKLLLLHNGSKLIKKHLILNPERDKSKNDGAKKCLKNFLITGSSA